MYFYSQNLETERLPAANKEQLNNLYTYVFQDFLLSLEWEKREEPIHFLGTMKIEGVNS